MNGFGRQLRYDISQVLGVVLVGILFNSSFVLAEESIPLEKLVVTKEKTFIINKKTYEVEVRILPDKHNQDKIGAAKTSFTLGVTTPNYYSNNKTARIVKLQGKVHWLLTIQTAYGKGQSPKTPSAYGRGTTEADLKSANVLLGFHEYCHRQDYIEYIKTRGLTDFGIKRGILVAKYKQLTEPKRLNAIATTLTEKMDIYSTEKTDEVGSVKRSDFLKRNE
ncbi:MAG: hypothetical protein COA78_05480 [Blastopirellula sp.]|nr:MAG: hypothetical protein COA78_05480 [Blastopirellula sp.]